MFQSLSGAGGVVRILAAVGARSPPFFPTSSFFSVPHATSWKWSVRAACSIAGNHAQGVRVESLQMGMLHVDLELHAESCFNEYRCALTAAAGCKEDAQQQLGMRFDRLPSLSPPCEN